MSSTRTSTRPSADASFASVGVPSLLIEALRDQGITSPFPIQTVTLPDIKTARSGKVVKP